MLHLTIVGASLGLIELGESLAEMDGRLALGVIIAGVDFALLRNLRKLGGGAVLLILPLPLSRDDFALSSESRIRFKSIPVNKTNQIVHNMKSW